MHKIKITLATITLVCSLQATAMPISIPQANLNLLQNLGSSIVNQQARLGGFRMSRSRPSYRNFGGSGSSSKSSTTNTKTNSTNNTSSTTNNQTKTNQQDAQFPPRAPATNTTQGLGTANAYTGGSPFLSSLAGTTTGVLLANMLFGSTAQASNQAAPMTPDKLTDEELKDCIGTLEDKMAELDATRNELLNSNSETKDADLAQLDKDQQQLKDLQLTLYKEQINRLK